MRTLKYFDSISPLVKVKKNKYFLWLLTRKIYDTVMSPFYIIKTNWNPAQGQDLKLYKLTINLFGSLFIAAMNTRRTLIYVSVKTYKWISVIERLIFICTPDGHCFYYKCKCNKVFCLNFPGTNFRKIVATLIRKSLVRYLLYMVKQRDKDLV